MLARDVSRGGPKAIVAVLAYTGLRLSEAVGLRRQDVDLVEGELRVRGQLSMARRDRPARIVPAKTAASGRDVPMMLAGEHALVEQPAVEQRAGRGGDGDFVFVTRRGTPMHQRNVAVRSVEAAARAAGIGKVTPKDLRASLCSLSGWRGVDPVEAAQITGHSLAVWTKHYAGRSARRSATKLARVCSSTASARLRRTLHPLRRRDEKRPRAATNGLRPGPPLD